MVETPLTPKRFDYRRSLRLVALLFAILGSANLWYGTSRETRNEKLLVIAERKLADPDSNKEQQLRYVRRLKARASFYSTVETGGRSLLAIALIMFVGAFGLPTKLDLAKLDLAKLDLAKPNTAKSDAAEPNTYPNT